MKVMLVLVMRAEYQGNGRNGNLKGTKMWIASAIPACIPIGLTLSHGEPTQGARGASLEGE